MDQVFAPWRIEWIERDDPNAELDGCVFCRLPEQESDRDHYVVARSGHSYVLLNNFPYNPGHAMVIPDVHTGDFRDLSDEELLDQNRLLQRTIDALASTLDPDGYNVGYNLGGPAAGGSVSEHLHAHVVPRWTGDTNFMPVLSDTKVIVEAVEQTYDHLYAAFADQDGATNRAEDCAVRIEE